MGIDNTGNLIPFFRSQIQNPFRLKGRVDQRACASRFIAHQITEGEHLFQFYLKDFQSQLPLLNRPYEISAKMKQ